MDDTNIAALRLAVIIVALLAIFWVFVGGDVNSGPGIVVTSGSGGGCGAGILGGCR